MPVLRVFAIVVLHEVVMIRLSTHYINTSIHLQTGKRLLTGINGYNFYRLQ
jgi:hypothetical protein